MLVANSLIPIDSLHTDYLKNPSSLDKLNTQEFLLTQFTKLYIGLLHSNDFT